MNRPTAFVDYERLSTAHRATAETWDAFVRDALVRPWVEAYDQQTPWESSVVEVSLGTLTYLFDAAPTFTGADAGDDRVIAVWGHSRPVAGKRDAARQAGFVPNPTAWSGVERDRGHFIAHSAGGGMDLNLFPQAFRLNRGSSDQGSLWTEMERHAAAHPGTPLFVRPSYGGSTWVPATIDYALLAEGRLRWERFDNRA